MHDYVPCAASVTICCCAYDATGAADANPVAAVLIALCMGHVRQ
jgi:hypothetical protein